MRRTTLLKAAVAVVAMLSLNACEPQKPPPKKKTAAPAQQQPTSPPREAGTPKVTAADPTADPSATPTWLPDPDELPGWIRTSNARILYAGDWNSVENAALRANLTAFRIKAATSFRYESVDPHPPGIVADVTIFEAYHSDDAYGLLTSTLHGAADQGVGSRSGYAAAQNTDRICWQNKYFIFVRAAGAAVPASRSAVDRLIAGLVEPLPSSDPPSLTAVLPTAGRIEGKLWIARRHLNTLPDEVLRGVLKGRAVETTQALKLNMDTLVVVAAFGVGTGERPNYVWLVQYPTPEAARQAYISYDGWRKRQKPRPLVSIEKPLGNYLCGSWTIDQESLMPMVPEIIGNLTRAPLQGGL